MLAQVATHTWRVTKNTMTVMRMKKRHHTGTLQVVYTTLESPLLPCSHLLLGQRIRLGPCRPPLLPSRRPKVGRPALQGRTLLGCQARLCELRQVVALLDKVVLPCQHVLQGVDAKSCGTTVL